MTEKQMPNSGQKAEAKPALNFLLISAGSVFSSMIISGFIVGYAFDWLMAYFFNIKTMPIFMLSCGLLGFIGGIQKVKQLLSKMDLLDPTLNKEQEKIKPNETK